MIKLRHLTLLYLFIFFSCSSFASVLMYDSLYEIHIPATEIEYCEAPHDDYAVETVIKPDFGKFKSLASVSVDPTKDTFHWLRIKITNHSSPNYKWIFQVPLHTQYVEFYYVYKDGRIVGQRTGQQFEFQSRDYDIRTFTYSLPYLREEEYTIYMKIKNRTFTDFHFIITDQEPYTRVLTQGYIFHGLIYGILLLMAIYNFILFLSIRSRVYIYYVLYVVCSAFFISWKDSLGFQYLWPDTPIINQYHHKMSLFVLVIALSLYSVSFLDLKTVNKKMYWTVLACLGINMFLFSFRVFQDTYFDAFPYDYFVTLLLNLFAAFYCIYKGIISARYFILGYSFMVSALVILKLRYLGLMEWSRFVEYSLNYAVVVEAVVMSFALRDKLSLFRKQKEQAQDQYIKEMKEREQAQAKLIGQMEENEKLKDKVNRELKEKVDERTTELKEKMDELSIAKEKLEESYKKLNEMSRILDLDNWNLKKDIKNERQSRINSELVSYQKFSELFPDENACLRFLYEKKWGTDGNDFECKKCKNLKSFELKNIKFAKKCTKCNYIETVSSNTLFHRVKFDLNKAFYIAYVSSEEPNANIVKLSDEIELRNNTCGKFFKRVEEKREEFKQTNKQTKNPTWENLILD